MGSDSTSLGTHLRQLRADREWTQAQLAEVAGFDMATISDWERGMHTPTLRSLFKLADALSVSPAALIQYQPASGLWGDDGLLATTVEPAAAPKSIPSLTPEPAIHGARA